MLIWPLYLDICICWMPCKQKGQVVTSYWFLEFFHVKNSIIGKFEARSYIFFRNLPICLNRKYTAIFLPLIPCDMVLW